MHKIPDIETTVTLDSIGDVTKSKWIGTFRVKCVLTNAEQFANERMFRQLIGKDNTSADSDTPEEKAYKEELRIRAATIAELSQRVVSGPPWWYDTKGGQLMIDSEPLYVLLQECHKAYAAWCKQLEESATFKGDAVVDPESP